MSDERTLQRRERDAAMARDDLPRLIVDPPDGAERLRALGVELDLASSSGPLVAARLPKGWAKEPDVARPTAYYVVDEQGRRHVHVFHRWSFDAPVFSRMVVLTPDDVVFRWEDAPELGTGERRLRVVCLVCRSQLDRKVSPFVLEAGEGLAAETIARSAFDASHAGRCRTLGGDPARRPTVRLRQAPPAPAALGGTPAVLDARREVKFAPPPPDKTAERAFLVWCRYYARIHIYEQTKLSGPPCRDGRLPANPTEHAGLSAYQAEQKRLVDAALEMVPAATSAKARTDASRLSAPEWLGYARALDNPLSGT